MMNEPEYCEIDVTARATLEKRTVVIGTGMHPCVEGETEPDGTRSYVTISEPNDDVRDLYRNQEMSPAEIFHNCEKVVKELKTLILSRKIEGCTSLTFARVDLTRLHDSLAGWDETEFEVFQD